MKKKIMAVTLCLAMVSTFAVGCGQKNETDSGKSEEKSSGKVEIEFVQVKREAAESYTKVIEAFEKENPDIVIKQNVVPDAQEVLMTRASSDSLPDMMNHWPTDAQFVQFEDEGLLLDLSEKDYMKNIDSKYLDAVKAKDGKNYIAPYNVNFMGVYYNKDKFEEAGYTMPTKWDEKIGILLMIGPCVVLLTQRFWAKISDRTGKRKEVLLVTIVGSGFSMLLYYLGNSFLCMFFATVVVTSFTTAVIPLSDAILIARSLKEGYSYSIIRLGGTLGYAVMTICAGMYLKTRPQMQFVFAFFAYMILFCFCIGLKEERNGQIVINEVVQENEQNRIFKNRDVYIVLGLAFVSQMGLSFLYGFYWTVYSRKRLHTVNHWGYK